MSAALDRVRGEYEAVRSVGGVVRREGRALLEVTGRDRAGWLHNLVTNQIKNLTAGEGVYAFATNLKGRCLFDLNALVLEDRIWVDVDRRRVSSALAHFNKYLISEDVRIGEVGGAARVGVMGARMQEVMGRLGLRDPRAMAQLQHVEVEAAGTVGRMVRHDWAGVTGVELVFVGGGDEACEGALRGVWEAARAIGLEEIGREAMEVVRMEEGIPSDVEDIDEEVVPPETGQVERGISYHKGCYLGQEVIERMRSHGVLARRLVGVGFEGAEVVAPGAAILAEGAEVGRTRSGCYSFGLGAALSLGYVKTGHAAAGTRVSVATEAGERAGVVVELPVGARD